MDPFKNYFNNVVQWVKSFEVSKDNSLDDKHSNCSEPEDVLLSSVARTNKKDSENLRRFTYLNQNQNLLERNEEKVTGLNKGVKIIGQNILDRDSSVEDLLEISKEEKKDDKTVCKDNKNFCENCQAILSKELKVPYCPKHKLCENCVIKASKSCRNCANYLKNLASHHNQTSHLCKCCKKEFLNSPLKCEYHAFCESCLYNKNYKLFDQIKNCRICSLDFNSLKYRESKKIESNSPNSSIKECHQMRLNNKRNHEDVEGKETFIQKICACKNCGDQINKAFKLPTCIYHEYCEICVKTGIINLDCFNCKRYLRALRDENRYYSRCCLCTENPLKPLYKCTSHRYCENCFIFLLENDFSHINTVNSCRDCTINFEKLKEVEKSKNNFDLTNQSKKVQDEISWNKIFNSEYIVKYESETIGNNMKSNFRNCSSKKCSTSTDQLFKVSNCVDHEYCAECIKSERAFISCENCSNYFRCVGQKKYSKENYCFLCNKYTWDSTIRCNLHVYCEICTGFLLKNDYNHIFNVNKCSKCCFNFKELKSNQEKEEGSLYFGRSRNEKIGKDYLENDAKNKVINPNSKLVIKSCASRMCSTKSETLFKTTRCTEHEYCSSCIKNERTSPRCTEHEYCSSCIKNDRTSPHCIDCKKYFQNLKSTIHTRSYCCICDESADNQDFACSSHKYCKICFEFLGKNDFTHIVLVNNCYRCPLYFKEIKSRDYKSSESSVERLLHSRQKDYDNSRKLDNKEKNRSIDKSQKIVEENTSLISKKCSSQRCMAQTDRLFKTSKCTLHEYCITCIKRDDNYTNCTYCNTYFKCMKPRSCILRNKCRLCDMHTSYQKPECESHVYCEECYNFLLKNDFEHIACVFNCSVCRLKLKKNKEETIKQDPYSPPTIEIDSHFPSKKNEADLKNRNINPAIEPKSTSNSKKCSLEKCSNQSNSLYKTPKCTLHEYCISCIQNRNNYTNCLNCFKYFRCIKPSHTISKSWCALCDEKITRQERGCYLHSYCTACYEFVLNNDYSYMITVTQCTECSKLLKNSKTQDKNKSSINEKQLTGPDFESISKFKKVESDYNRKSKYENNLWQTPNFIDKNKNSRCSACQSEMDKGYATSRCSEHRYCKNCIISKQSRNKACELCNMYFQSLMLVKDPSKLRCTLCGICPNSPDIKCPVHSYCQYCYEYLINNECLHIIAVADCRECRYSINLIQKKKATDSAPEKNNETRRIQVNSTEIDPDKLQNQNFSSKTKPDSIKLPRNYDTEDAEFRKQFKTNSGFAGQNWKSNNSRCSGFYCSSIGEFLTPRCTEHRFCMKCFKSGSKYFRCEFCIMYFESISRRMDQNIFQCSLCKLAPINSEIKCNVHKYCKYCYDFISNSDYSHLINVVNCQECCKFLKLIKEKNASKLNSKDNIEKPSNIIDSSKIPSSSPNTSPYFTVYDIPEESKPYTPNISDSKTALKAVKSNTKPVVIENQYPSPQVIYTNPVNNHFEPENLNNQDLKKSYINLSELINCSNCSEKLLIKAFLCNHNLCIFCLVKICCYQIHNFFIHYQQDPNNVQKFDYYCLLNSCNQKISVPTKMILVNLKKFLYDPVKGQELACYSYLATPGNLDQWIAYFDGLALE